MARLQILTLPEGAGDDRPPYVLVVDQLPTGDEKYDALRRDLADNDIVARTGASAALCFEGTIEIPANEAPLLAEADDAERAGTTQIVYAHERTRLDLCSALLFSGDTTWRKLIEAVAERQRELASLFRQLDRVQALSETPSIMDAQHPHPNAYLHGYRVAIDDAKRAIRNERATAVDDGESAGRPTHPDGSPYRYHEIKAGGWEHCDGCRSWGKWTTERPHACPGTYNHGPVVPTPGS